MSALAGMPDISSEHLPRSFVVFCLDGYALRKNEECAEDDRGVTGGIFSLHCFSML